MEISLSDRVCTLSRSRPLFPLDKVPSTLEIDSLPRTNFLVLLHTCRRHAMGSPYLMMLAGYRSLPPAAENHQGFRRLRLVVLGVEAVSFRGVVDRRVLTADVDASLGLITCEMCGFGQAAKLKSSARSGAGGSLDSSHWQ